MYNNNNTTSRQSVLQIYRKLSSGGMFLYLQNSIITVFTIPFCSVYMLFIVLGIRVRARKKERRKQRSGKLL